MLSSDIFLKKPLDFKRIIKLQNIIIIIISSFQQCPIVFSFSSSSSGQQCCYGDNGRLIVGPFEGGTPNLVSPDQSYVRHLYHDVLPWLLCCGLSNECEKYYENRPSDDGSRYVPPSIGKIN